MTHPRAGRTIRETVPASNRHLPANNRHRPANNRQRPAGTTPPAGHGTATGSPGGQAAGADEATSAGGGATLMTVAT